MRINKNQCNLHQFFTLKKLLKLQTLYESCFIWSQTPWTKPFSLRILVINKDKLFLFKILILIYLYIIFVLNTNFIQTIWQSNMYALYPNIPDIYQYAFLKNNSDT